MPESLEPYTLEANLLYEHLGRLTEGGIVEQLAAVGPASVPELGVAAPREIALAVWPFPLEDASQSVLTFLGYKPVAGVESTSEQHFFHAAKGIRLYLIEVGSDSFTDRLILRDFLRHSSEARARFLASQPLPEQSPEAAALLEDAQRWWIDFQGFSPVERVAHELRDFPLSWFFSSGWALDLFLGRVTRVHHDVDVVIPRSAIWPIKRYLNQRGWQFVLPLNGRLEPWPPESTQKPDIQMHAHREGEMLDLLLTEMDDETWHYRRDPRITSPAAQALLHDEAGLPYLGPELVLLFKSKNTSRPQTSRPQDEGDFATVLPHLSAGQRGWLRDALLKSNPEHSWLKKL